MIRREFLGTATGAAVVGISGCLAPLVDATTRTGARPAFTMPPVGEWRERLEGDRPGGDGMSLRANNHNTTRSNRYQMAAGPAGDLSVGWWISAWHLRSDGTARSGRPLAEDSGDTGTNPLYTSRAERARTEEYLAGESTIGETFVLSVPSVDFPGVPDPGADVQPADIIPAEGTIDEGERGNRPADGIARLTALASVSGLTELPSAAGDGVLWVTDRSEAGRAAESSGPFVVSWNPDDFAGAASPVDAVSEPVVARAIVTLADGVTLPVLFHARRLRHAGDWIFVVGWVLDGGGLHGDVGTVLVDGSPNRVVRVGEADARRSDPPASVVDALDERERMGALFFDGPVTPELASFLPPRLREDDELTAFAEAAAAATGPAPRTGPSPTIPRQRIDRMADTLDVIRRDLADCESDMCDTLRAHATARKDLIRDARSNLEAGDVEAARTALRELREVAEGDLQRLVGAAAEEFESIVDVPGLERALLRETTFALDPLDADDDGDGSASNGDGSASTGDGPASNGDLGVEELELAVEKIERDIAGDDDGDGIWDALDRSAVDGPPSANAMRVGGDVLAVGNTFAPVAGRAGMDAVDVGLAEGTDDANRIRWMQSDGPYVPSVVRDGNGPHIVATVLADGETGRAIDRLELVERIATTADVSAGHAGRTVDAFVDTAARLHPDVEAARIARQLVVAEPGPVDDEASIEDLVGDYLDALRGEFTGGSVPGATVVTLDATLVHLTSACRDCTYTDSWLTAAVGPGSTGPPAPIRVLHVDDEPGFAEVAGRLLEREDDRLAVTPVTSPEAGLAHVRENPDRVDVVLLDIQMPRMNGFEFTRAVREDYPDLPVVLFTVSSLEAVREEARAAGVSDHVEKGTVDQYARLTEVIDRLTHKRPGRPRSSALWRGTGDARLGL